MPFPPFYLLLSKRNIKLGGIPIKRWGMKKYFLSAVTSFSSDLTGAPGLVLSL
jgi:hypothetical protein